jgi:sugar lactone lactonase YvrE
MQKFSSGKRNTVPRQRPVRWQPPPAKRGSPTALPVSVVKLPSAGAEDVLIDRSGSIVSGLTNGDVVRVNANGCVVLGNTGGRPLGVEEFADGSLLVCDHDRGLLHLDVATGQVKVLLDEFEGRHVHFCSNAVICANETLYVTTSSDSATWEDFREDVIAHATSGRLIRVLPDGQLTVLRENLAFANGIVLAPDESYLLVAETIRYRILKYWLKGPLAGQVAEFVSGMPGFPDNLSLSESGLVWVALPAPRVPLLDFLLPRHPLLRQVLRRVPQRLQPQPERIVHLQAYDLDGQLVHDIKTKHPHFSFVTAVAERNGTVWLASVHHDVLGRIDLPSKLKSASR